MHRKAKVKKRVKGIAYDSKFTATRYVGKKARLREDRGSQVAGVNPLPFSSDEESVCRKTLPNSVYPLDSQVAVVEHNRYVIEGV